MSTATPLILKRNNQKVIIARIKSSAEDQQKCQILLSLYLLHVLRVHLHGAESLIR